jgi:hypothetical protein
MRLEGQYQLDLAWKSTMDADFRDSGEPVER